MGHSKCSLAVYSKKVWRSNDFWVSLYLPIIFTSVPGHGDKSTPLNRGCILQLILEPGI
jgi:hypothetical protein